MAFLAVVVPADAHVSPWNVVSSPNGYGGSALRAVAAISPSDAWAVGFDGAGPLIEHWNGTSWSVVPGPVVVGGRLKSISAPAADDVWAAGATGNGGPLIEHYNGTRWSILATVPPHAAYIGGISAMASNDVWSEDVIIHNNGGESLNVVHWNGSTWSSEMLNGEPPGVVVAPRGVIEFSPNLVWAWMEMKSATYGPVWLPYELWPPGPGLMLAWDAASASDGGGMSANGVGASSPTDIWEVGSLQSDAAAAHFTGTPDWATPATTSYAACCHSFNAVAPASPTDVWAVGRRWDATTPGAPIYNLLEHWDGVNWAEYGGPNPTTANNLTGVASVPGASTFWAVGQTGTGSAMRTLVLRCC